MFTWGRADYGQLGRRLESAEAQRPVEQDSPPPFQRPQDSVPSPLHCLAGAAEVSGDFLRIPASQRRLSVVASWPHSPVFPEGFLYASLSHDMFIQESERVLAHKKLLVYYDREVGSWLPTCPTA